MFNKGDVVKLKDEFNNEEKLELISLSQQKFVGKFIFEKEIGFLEDYDVDLSFSWVKNNGNYWDIPTEWLELADMETRVGISYKIELELTGKQADDLLVCIGNCDKNLVDSLWPVHDKIEAQIEKQYEALEKRKKEDLDRKNFYNLIEQFCSLTEQTLVEYFNSKPYSEDRAILQQVIQNKSSIFVLKGAYVNRIHDASDPIDPNCRYFKWDHKTLKLSELKPKMVLED